MAESTRQTWHMSPTCWPRRMLLCVPLWCAVTSLSMEACSPATALCRACRRPTAAAVVERAATVRLETATDTADDQDTTLAAAPLRHSSEILDASSSVWGFMRGRWRFFLRRPKLFLSTRRRDPMSRDHAHDREWLKCFTAFLRGDTHGNPWGWSLGSWSKHLGSGNDRKNMEQR
jgi:hypothetical protein